MKGRGGVERGCKFIIIKRKTENSQAVPARPSGKGPKHQFNENNI